MLAFIFFSLQQYFGVDLVIKYSCLMWMMRNDGWGWGRVMGLDDSGMFYHPWRLF